MVASLSVVGRSTSEQKSQWSGETGEASLFGLACHRQRIDVQRTGCLELHRRNSTACHRLALTMGTGRVLANLLGLAVGAATPQTTVLGNEVGRASSNEEDVIRAVWSGHVEAVGAEVFAILEADGEVGLVQLRNGGRVDFETDLDGAAFRQ